MAMLDLLTRGGYVGIGDGKVADKTRGEKAVSWDSGLLVYVEFCGVVGGVDRTERMRGLAEERGLGFIGFRAEDVFDPGSRKRLGRDDGSEIETANKAVDLKHPGDIFS